MNIMPGGNQPVTFYGRWFFGPSHQYSFISPSFLPLWTMSLFFSLHPKSRRGASPASCAKLNWVAHRDFVLDLGFVDPVTREIDPSRIADRLDQAISLCSRPALDVRTI
ncbi:hypothetical protein RSAG8_02008, partial [Rhizoctonia solani AG-8 WAC10335]